MSALIPPADNSAADAAGMRPETVHTAFLAFHAANHHAVEIFLRRLEHDRGLVEEVVQDAFMAVLDRWTRLTDPRTYLLAIARNMLRDQQRRRSRTPILFIDDVRLLESPEPGTPDEAEDKLQQWIRLLPPRMGEVISLSLEKHRDRDIAMILGISHNTVREYKAVAKRKLQQLAEAEGHTTPAGRRRG